MTQTGKRELLEAVRPRYLRANKADKGRIPHEFVATTGYHRKYAIRLPRHGAGRRSRTRRPGRRTYTPAVIDALTCAGRIFLSDGILDRLDVESLFMGRTRSREAVRASSGASRLYSWTHR